MAYPKLPRLPQESGGTEEDEFTKLPGLPQAGGENPFDITRIAKERFGVDISPEARAQAESAARTRQAAASGSAAAQQFFAGMAGKPGSADQGIESQRQAIDADTIGAFDAKRKRTIEDVEFGDKQLDRARKHAQEDLDFGEENDPNSQLSGLAREAAGKLGVQLNPQTSYSHIKRVAPWLLEHVKAEREKAENQENPQESHAMGIALGIAQGRLPINTDIPLAGVGTKVKDRIAMILGAARGRENTDNRSRRLRGLPAEKLGSYESTLNHIDSLNQKIPGFKTGFLRNKIDRARWFASMDDSQRTALKGQLSALLSDYTLAMSGKASNENEATRLKEFVPTIEDSPESLMDKMDGFQDWTKRNYSTWIKSYRRRDYDLEEELMNAQERGWLDAAGLPTAPPDRSEPPADAPAQQPAAGGTIKFDVDGKRYNLPTGDAGVIQRFQQKYPNAKRVQ